MAHLRISGTHGPAQACNGTVLPFFYGNLNVGYKFKKLSYKLLPEVHFLNRLLLTALCCLFVLIFQLSKTLFADPSGRAV